MGVVLQQTAMYFLVFFFCSAATTAVILLLLLAVVEFFASIKCVPENRKDVEVFKLRFTRRRDKLSLPPLSFIQRAIHLSSPPALHPHQKS